MVALLLDLDLTSGALQPVPLQPTRQITECRTASTSRSTWNCRHLFALEVSKYWNRCPIMQNPKVQLKIWQTLSIAVARHAVQRICSAGRLIKVSSKETVYWGTWSLNYCQPCLASFSQRRTLQTASFALKSHCLIAFIISRRRFTPACYTI